MTSELRIKIAESLGWKTIRKLYWNLNPDDGYRLVGFSPDDPFPHERGEQNVPDYFSDANAALQLVEVMAKGWDCVCVFTHGEWNIDFCKPGTIHRAHAPTFPEAICNAYCKVRGINTNEQET